MAILSKLKKKSFAFPMGKMCVNVEERYSVIMDIPKAVPSKSRLIEKINSARKRCRQKVMARAEKEKPKRT